ncbi:gamma-glutamyltransferase [Pelagibius litoralis]|uniref:Gamma-glutamyltransferase n=1 Tax=Pelagibius litoralis TaxID=374515 RepID=A0A967EZB7_9PROT|nr:gamma-glutamyltransferase [Pelagibius litoralis]NIA70178.1 gamma-glutamyltransferase [Pelagibius litoralis]
MNSGRSGGKARPLGAVACGHPQTAAAAEEILAEGGNAFDAVIAAFCASCVAEPVLCSLGGGGFLLAQSSGREALLYDFFVQTPRGRKPLQALDFYPILADFGTATQEFHIGLGAVATPGAVRGIFSIHRELASLPMKRLIEPATRLAREGVTVRPIDAYLFQVVAPILTAKAGPRSLFTGPDGALLAAGEPFRQPRLADTFEALASEGEALFYEGDLAEQLVALCRAEGGLLSAADLANYRTVKRKPFVTHYRSAEVVTNPPPSCGGILIGFALGLLAEASLHRMDARSEERLLLIARVMDLTNKARVEARLEEASGEAEEAAAAARLFDPSLLERYAAEVAGQGSFTRGTTHISVVDAAGNLAAMSLSNGEGCGTHLADSGIMLNNMLGEEDLNRGGFHRWPRDSRLSSMMAPTLATSAEGALFAIGSGGSNRIRTAILQVLTNILDHGMSLGKAIETPRLHLEADIANLEKGLVEGADRLMAERGCRTIDWPAHNLFFGGVHGVARHPDGSFTAAGDPRRGGAAVIV